MDFGFGSWMGDEDEMEEDVAEDEIPEINIEAELDKNPDAITLEEAAALGGLFGAATEEAEKEEKVLEDLMNPFDATDMEILSDKGMSPIYRDNPEFARFVWDRIHKDMKEADEELVEKLRKIRKKQKKC